jgi:hypothetical protein
MHGTTLETKGIKKSWSLRGFTRIHIARHRFKEEQQTGQNAKKFLKKGNSKRGLVSFLGNPYTHRTVIATDKPSFSGVKMK